jgi:thiamine biosynthesis protein ThiS
MKISLKTAGTLGQYLPPGSARNNAQLDVADGSSPIDVIAKLGMPPADSYLVTLNGSIVPTAKRSECKLRDGDQLSIMPPLKGG